MDIDIEMSFWSFRRFGEWWLMQQKENSTSHPVFIPALPPEIGQQLLYYLVHIQPWKKFLARKVYDQRAQSLYHDFLYIQMSKHVMPGQLSFPRPCLRRHTNTVVLQ